MSMRSTVQGIVVAATVVSVASGCVPERDNPIDPSVAPAARLSIVSLAPCESILPGEWPIVSTASRGACLALDARKTHDPQGDGDLSYTYFFADEDGDPVDFIVKDSPLDFYPIPPSQLRIQGDVANGGGVTQVGVTVTDPTGAKGTALTGVILTNSAPQIPEPVPILLPEGGYPWARGLPMPIVLDGSAAKDPDGDDRIFCWTLPETPPDTCEWFERTWMRSIAPTAGRQEFHLVVSDGAYFSEKTTYVVRVGPPPLWAAAENLRRFDETEHRLSKPAGALTWFGSGAGGEEWVLFYEPSLQRIEIHRWPDLVPTGLTIDLGLQTADLAIATPLPGGGTRIWVAARSNASSIDLKAYDLDENGDTLTPVGTKSVSSSGLRLMSADPDGNVVIGGAVDPLDPSVLEFVSADTVMRWTVPLAIGTTIEGGDVIPETSIFSITASGGLDDPNTGDDYVGDRILVYQIGPPPDDPRGTVEPQEIQVIDGIGPLRQLEYIDHERFWATNPNTGLTLFNRDNLATLAIAPEILEVKGFLRVDHGTGACHFATASSLVTVDVEGRVRRDSIDAGTPIVEFVDGDGAVGSDTIDGNVLRVSRTLDSDAVVSVLDFKPINPQRSHLDGGVWAVTSAPAIVHLSENGTTLEYITELFTEDAGRIPLVAPQGVVDPYGQGGWFTDFVGASEVLYRVDFIAPRGNPASLPASVVPNLPAGFHPIGASSPTAFPKFAWVWKAGPNPRYGTIDTDGNFGAWLDLSGEAMSDDSPGAVVARGSDDLCVFSQVGTTSTLNHRRVRSDGVVTPAVAVLVTSGQMDLRSPFTFPEPDVCGVVAGENDTHVFVWDSNAALDASYVELDRLDAVTAAGDGIYWGTGSLAGQPSERLLTRMVAGTSGTLVRETIPLDVPNTFSFLP